MFASKVRVGLTPHVRTELFRALNLDLPEHDGHIWHGYVPGIGPGQPYGFRAHGPYRPDEGHRFNPNKLLLDPYAKRISVQPAWDDSLFGYAFGGPAADLGFDARNSARFMPRSLVTDTAFDWGEDRPPRRPAPRVSPGSACRSRRAPRGRARRA